MHRICAEVSADGYSLLKQARLVVRCNCGGKEGPELYLARKRAAGSHVGHGSERMEPFIVTMDSTGDSRYDTVRAGATKRIAEIYK